MPRATCTITVLLALIVATALSAPVAADVAPVLGSVWAPNQQGFGRAHPSHIYAGGDPTSIVKHIHWRGWGRSRATAHHAIALWGPPAGPVAGARPAEATVVASHLGTCNGRRAYRKIQWWFPGHGGRRGGVYGFGPDQMCKGTTTP